MTLQTTRPDPTLPHSTQTENAEPALSGGLAALLDRFSASVLSPETHTFGDLATTVQALHAEMSMLAHHVRSNETLEAEAIDFDAIFPVVAAVDDPEAYAGIADHEALEDLCRTLSR